MKPALWVHLQLTGRRMKPALGVHLQLTGACSAILSFPTGLFTFQTEVDWGKLFGCNVNSLKTLGACRTVVG